MTTARPWVIHARVRSGAPPGERAIGSALTITKETVLWLECEGCGGGSSVSVLEGMTVEGLAGMLMSIAIPHRACVAAGTRDAPDSQALARNL